MRKRYLLFTILCLPNLVNAQISLTAAMAPPTGSMFIYYDANVPIPAFTFSKSGTSNTWDFTTISPLPTEEDTTFIVSPATIPGSVAFPTATHAFRDHDSPAFNIISVNASNALFLGAIGDVFGTGTNIPTTLVPPLTAFTFPYTFGSSISGTSNMEIFATGAVIGQPTIDSVRFKSNITTTHEVVASGNMIIPSGTFASLLERQINTTIDSAWIKAALTGGMWIPAPGFPTISTDSSFNWYTAQSLQKFAHALYDATGLSDVVFFKSSTVGLNENMSVNTPIVYPNPVRNTLNINLAPDQLNDVKFSIYNISGKEIIRGAGNIQKLDVTNLVSGMYFLKLDWTDGKQSIQKFVKE